MLTRRGDINFSSSRRRHDAPPQVTLLKALARCDAAGGFRGLPRSRAAARGFLVAAGGAKGESVFDELRKSVESCNEPWDVESAARLIEELLETQKLKRDRGQWPRADVEGTSRPRGIAATAPRAVRGGGVTATAPRAVRGRIAAPPRPDAWSRRRRGRTRDRGDAASKRDRSRPLPDAGPDLDNRAKQAARRAAKACRARTTELRQIASGLRPQVAAAAFAATDVRLDLDAQPSPSREADLTDYFDKCSLRVHPDRRRNLGGHGHNNNNNK